jgi:hypothetical protein
MATEGFFNGLLGSGGAQAAASSSAQRAARTFAARAVERAMAGAGYLFLQGPRSKLGRKIIFFVQLTHSVFPMILERSLSIAA